MISLKIPLPAIHERVEYEVYQGGKVIKRGDFIARSFTPLGRNRLAGMMVNSPWKESAMIATYRVLVDAATWYSSAASVVSFNRNAGTITAETQEFDQAGEYKRIQGGWKFGSPPLDDVDSYYHYVTTSLTIGAGQTVKFFVEYQFSGLGSEIAWGGLGNQNSGNYPSVVGDIVCAAVLFDFQGDAPYFNEPIGSLEMLTENCKGSTDYGDEPAGEKFSTGGLGGADLSRSNNYVLISGPQWSCDATHGIWWLRILTSHATVPKVFHEWSVSADGDASGSFRIEPPTDVKVQTDVAFTFG